MSNTFRYNRITDEEWGFYLSKNPYDFLKEISRNLASENRFFVDKRFEKLLYWCLFDEQSRFLEQIEIMPPKNFWRSRIYRCSDVMERMANPEKYGVFQGYGEKDSGAVPREKASMGRANPEGISYLYVSSDEKTSVLEIEAQAGEYVSVATLELKERAFLWNLAKDYSIVWANTSEKENWINSFILGLGAIFQRPYSQMGNYYLCQFISEFAKKFRMDGIMYRASHVQNGYGDKGINFIFFNPSKCEVVSSRLRYVVGTEIEIL